MDTLLHRLLGRIPEPVDPLDTGAIFEAARALEPWMAGLLLLVGLGLAGFGSRGLSKRLMVALGAGLVGYACVGAIAWLPASEALPWIAALGTGLAGLRAPALGAGLAGLLVGAWIVRLLGGDAPRLVLTQIVFAPLVGVFFALLSRWLAAVFSALLGSVVTVIAAISLLPPELRHTLAAYPAAPLLPMVVIACTGAAFQIARLEDREDEEAPPVPAGWSPSR